MSSYKLAICIGKTIGESAIVVDLLHKSLYLYAFPICKFIRSRLMRVRGFK